MSNFVYYRRYNENAGPSTGSLGQHGQSVPSKVLEPLLQVCVCIHQGGGCSLCFLSTGSHTEGASGGREVCREWGLGRAPMQKRVMQGREVVAGSQG